MVSAQRNIIEVWVLGCFKFEFLCKIWCCRQLTEEHHPRDVPKGSHSGGNDFNTDDDDYDDDYAHSKIVLRLFHAVKLRSQRENVK